MNTLLALTYCFMLACTPYENIGLGETQESYEKATHVQYELGLDIAEHFHLYTGEETKQVPVGSLFNWRPYTQAYYVGAEAHYDFSEALKLKAGVVHRCEHPTASWGEKLSSYDRAYTEFYLNVSGKIKLR